MSVVGIAVRAHVHGRRRRSDEGPRERLTSVLIDEHLNGHLCRIESFQLERRDSIVGKIRISHKPIRRRLRRKIARKHLGRSVVVRQRQVEPEIRSRGRDNRRGNTGDKSGNKVKGRHPIVSFYELCARRYLRGKRDGIARVTYRRQSGRCDARLDQGQNADEVCVSDVERRVFIRDRRVGREDRIFGHKVALIHHVIDEVCILLRTLLIVRLYPVARDHDRKR